MRLSINGWPPIASHLACILLGVSATNLSWSTPEQSLQLAANTVVLSLTRVKGPPLPAVGTRAHVIKGDGSAACRLSETPLIIVERYPQAVVSASLQQATLIPTLVKGLKTGALVLRDATSQASTPLCRSEPKVSYGS